MTLNSVVLPAPFGPIRAQIWPSSMVKVRPSSATTPPKRTLTSCTPNSVPIRLGTVLARRRRSGSARRSVGRNPWPLLHEHDLQGVVGLDAAAGAEDHALEGQVDELDGTSVSWLRRSVEAPRACRRRRRGGCR